MIEWGFGVFSIMAIMVTILGIVIAARYLYIDRQYTSLQRRQESVLSTYLKESQEAAEGIGPTVREFLDDILIVQESIGRIKARINNNRNEGIMLDFLAMGVILAAGIFASFGVFDQFVPFVLLNVILIMWLAISLSHSVTHLRGVHKLAIVTRAAHP